MIDLGFVLCEECTSWPTCAPLHRTVHKRPEDTAFPNARNKQSFTLNGGCGTHLDAPSHFVPHGRTVEQIGPSELTNVPLAIIDCSSASDGDGDYMMGMAAIVADEAANGRIPTGALVCVRTGWAAARYSDRDQYYNATDASDVDPSLGLARMHFPGVSAEAATFLVRERGCVGLGIDTLSPDGGGGASAGFPTHHAVLGADRYILENLRLAGDVPPRGARANVAPLNVRGAPEAPARVFAVLGGDQGATRETQSAIANMLMNAMLA